MNDKPREIKYIVVHCSATVEGVNYTKNDIDIWHKKRGWNGIGYHFVIDLNGSIEKGRPLEKAGAHVKGYNKESIGIVYIGGLDKNKIPKDTRNECQKESLIKILTELKNKYPNSEIKGHRDFSPDINKNGIIEPNEFIKKCPCFDAIKEYSYIK